uniref:Tenascin N n=1 Tax=Fundulus heteroclitus TaxID=8078 RepID=A0A3Q2R3U7_FUNHE
AAMSTGLLWRALCLLTTLCTVSHHVRCIENQTDPSGTEQGLTFSHVYKIDIPGSSSCTKLNFFVGLQQDTAINGENDIVFKHNIKLQTPKCNCEESESFKDLLYRINGLEEEVTYLKTQCTQGCCGRGGVDTSCSGHGSYQDDTCSCLCNPGWEGPDCSLSSCPDECSDSGRCVDGKCVCYEGYTGEDCSQQTCPGDCNDKGQCVDGKCVCYEGYTGEDCSQQTCPGDCNDKGQCVDGKCVCYEGYTGEDCSHQTCPGDCNDKGQCVDGKCVCYEGYTGEDCSQQTCPGDCMDYCFKVPAVAAETETGLVDCLTWQSKVKLLSILKPSFAYICISAGLYPGTEYKISVQSIKGNTEGKASFTTGVTDIDAPTNLVTTEVTEDTATVSWDKVQAEIEGYMLRYTSSESSSSDIFVGRDSTSYRLVGLRPGVLHTVYIWAFRGDKVSGKSSTEAETEIDSPKDLKASDVTLDSASLTWVPPLADIEGYILTYRDEDGNLQDVERRLEASKTSFAASNLEIGKKYIVTIIAFRGSKRSKVVETTFKTVGAQHPFPMDCEQIMKNGNKNNGLYTVYISNDRSKPIEVYCDMTTDGGDQTEFALTLLGEIIPTFWNVFVLLCDAMTYHQGRPWTTIDSDNDIALTNCAMTHSGAWWYKNCHLANLNGKWGDNRHSLGVNWEPWKGHLTSLDFTEMKIRPVGVVSSRKKRSLMARERKSRASNGHKK